MRRLIAFTMSLALASMSLPLTGCDTGADKGATPPKDKMATPAKGPTTGGAGQAGGAGGAGGSTAPQVLPPPPDK